MRGLPSILSLFRNEFIRFRNTRARMLYTVYSIYHMTNTLKSHFWRKNVIILSLCTERCYGRQNISRKYINHKWYIDFYCMALFHSQTRRHMINTFSSTMAYIVCYISLFLTNTQNTIEKPFRNKSMCSYCKMKAYLTRFNNGVI